MDEMSLLGESVTLLGIIKLAFFTLKFYAVMENS